MSTRNWERGARYARQVRSAGGRRSERAAGVVVYDLVKRFLDALIAAVALVVLSPVMAIVAGLVALALGRPVLFTQIRPGWHARPFLLVKFRTMHHIDRARGLVTDAQRLTAVGRWLRSTSLDELPTLWNVLRGQMSLVGPRPLLMSYLPRYSPLQARRHEVRPGVTGLAQVRGRNWLSWDEKFNFDIWYVEHRSLALDLRILAETVGVVLRRKGISADGVATAGEFLGNAADGRR
jgi:lipopolysaccharide/colanic/teichoic acid biosynthesis glycosyltransferase